MYSVAIKSFLLFLLLINVSFLNAQKEGWEFSRDLRVMDSKGVYLRDSCSASSKIVTSIPFGAHVKEIDVREPVQKDTIDGMEGYWQKVKYHRWEGYVFNVFISRSLPEYNPLFKKGLPQFCFEWPWTCGELTYHNPKLYWYGVYPRYQNKYEIRRVDIEFNVSKENRNKYEYNMEELDMEYFSMKSSDTAKSLIMFGHPDSTLEGKIRKITLPQNCENESYKFNRNLYPGEYIRLENSYYLVCYGKTKGNVIDNEWLGECNDNRFEMYKVQLVFKDQDTLKIVQDLKMKPNDIIEFAGDLNADGISDLIVRECINMYLTKTYLLMSGYEEGGRLTKVAENYWESCY